MDKFVCFWNNYTNLVKDFVELQNLPHLRYNYGIYQQHAIFIEGTLFNQYRDLILLNIGQFIDRHITKQSIMGHYDPVNPDRNIEITEIFYVNK